MGKAKAILSLKSPDEQLKIFSEMIGERASVRDVERAIAAHAVGSRKGSVRRDPNLTAQEQLIQDRLGSSVRITARGEQGTITITYYSKEEFKRLMGELT